MTQALHPELDIYFHLGLVPIPHDHNPSLLVNPEKLTEVKTSNCLKLEAKKSG